MWNFLPYWLISALITFIQFMATTMPALAAIIEFLIMGGLIYFLSLSLSKGGALSSGFWYKSVMLNSLTCTCPTCEEWRRGAKKPRWVALFMATAMVYLISSFAITRMYDFMAKGKYPKRSTATIEFKAKYKDLEFSLRTSLENEYYDIRLIPDNEIITGKRGKYYVVELKTPNLQDTVFFKSGQYVMKSYEKALTKPLNAFIDSVYSYLDAGTECTLYLRGSADILGNETLNAKFNPNYDDENFHKIRYYPKQGESDKFANEESLHTIGDYYKNVDLPLLRSAFIQQKIIQNYNGIPAPNLLEGEVEKEINPELRNALLIMYVNFNMKKFND